MKNTWAKDQHGVVERNGNETCEQDC